MRGSVSDRAGNVTEAFVDLPEGTASQPDLVSAAAGFDEPPVTSQFSNDGGSDITAGPGFTPVSEKPQSSRGAAAGSPRPSRAVRGRVPQATSDAAEEQRRRTWTATHVRA